MKKILVLAISVLALSSCEIEGGSKTGEMGDFTFRTIEGCEYIEYDHGCGEGHVYSITHKGNCKNHENN